MNALATQSGMAASGAATPPDSLDDYDLLLRCEAADEVYSPTGEASFGDSVSRWGNLAFGPRYLSLPGTAGNNAGTEVALDWSEDFELTLDLTLDVFGTATFLGVGNSSRIILVSGSIQFRCGGTSVGNNLAVFSGVIPTAGDYELVFSWDSAAKELSLTVNGVFTETVAVASFSNSTFTFIGAYEATNTQAMVGSFRKIIKTGAVPFELDFANWDIGQTIGTAATGQPVTINQSGDPVAQITADQGASDALQADPAKQPLYLEGVLGKPVIRFDGVDNFMEVTLDASRSNLHAWFVIQHTASQNNQRAFSIDSDNLSSPQFDEFAGAYRVGGNSNNWGDVLERNVLEVRWTNLGNACAFYIDGVAQFTTGAVSFSTLKLFLAGFTSATFPHAAVDYEAIFVANGILNNEESAEITALVNAKYSVFAP